MKKILIVDDEREMADILCRIIKRRPGFEALAAANCEEAVRLYSDFLPDCVFLDLHLPDAKGTEVLRRLREINPEVKAYFITGDLVFIERNIPESVGAEGFLLKPIEVEEVLKIADSLSP